MYYQERVIEGVLCWRGTPDGKWIKMSNKALTRRIKEQQIKLDNKLLTQ